MKKSLLMLGTITATSLPVAAVVACGNNNQTNANNNQINKINHGKPEKHIDQGRLSKEFLANAKIYLDSHSTTINKKLPSAIPTLTSNNLLDMFDGVTKNDAELKGITFSDITKSNKPDQDTTGKLDVSFKMTYKGKELKYRNTFTLYTTSKKEYEENLAAIKAINGTNIWTKINNIPSNMLSRDKVTDWHNVSANDYVTRLQVPPIQDWGKTDQDGNPQQDSHEYDGMSVVSVKPSLSPLILGATEFFTKGTKGITDHVHEKVMSNNESALFMLFTIRKGTAEFEIYLIIRGFAG